MKKIAVVVATLLPALSASAHPGHGTTDPNSVAHYIVEPVHGVVLVMALALSAAMLALRARAARDDG